MKLWFYVKTPGVVHTLDNESTLTVYPYASKMREMKPLSKVDPSVDQSEERKSCDKAFALACRYSGGLDLVEEMATSDFWLLGHQNEDFKIEIVQVPVFGPVEGLPFPRFERELGEDQIKESFLVEVESCVHRIVGKMSEWEYLAQRTSQGMMPHFNRVLEEYGIHHEEYEVPTEILAGIKKKRDVATRNVTVKRRPRNRRVVGRLKP
jgi:hypothetical protein